MKFEKIKFEKMKFGTKCDDSKTHRAARCDESLVSLRTLDSELAWLMFQSCSIARSFSEEAKHGFLSNHGNCSYSYIRLAFVAESFL